MDACELPARDAEDVARVIRALGAHRYVAGRVHMVHAFVFASAAPSVPGDDAELTDAVAWSLATLADPTIDPGSRDERLVRPSSDAEVARVLSIFWSPDERAEAARAKLLELLVGADIAPPATDSVFDETTEEDVFPILIDAGWELHALAELDPERHKGVILAFGESILFEAARFEEENALEHPRYLQELPAIGPAELLAGVDAHGFLREPLTLWTEGAPVYHDYVIRGVLRSARLA